jgi:hypothetical protein
MSLESFYYISQIIASFAVLASLIYLALQTRQTTKNQRALMNQGVINRISDTIHWMSEPRMVDLNVRITAGETRLNAQELYLLNLRLRGILTSVQDTFVQHQAGLVDQITMDAALAATRNFLSQPVNRAIWKGTRATYAPQLTAWVDGMIEKTPRATPVDSVAQFNAHLAEVMG